MKKLYHIHHEHLDFSWIDKGSYYRVLLYEEKSNRPTDLMESIPFREAGIQGGHIKTYILNTMIWIHSDHLSMVVLKDRGTKPALGREVVATYRYQEFC